MADGESTTRKGVGLRMSLQLPRKTDEQLRVLGEMYNLSKTAVVAQAVARWYRSDPLVRSMKQEAPPKE